MVNALYSPDFGMIFRQGLLPESRSSGPLPGVSPDHREMVFERKNRRVYGASAQGVHAQKLYSLESNMKKLVLAAAAAVAAAPVAAQQANDPFVSTAAAGIPALAIIGGVAVIVAIAASSGTD
jgi:hypothetical protein